MLHEADYNMSISPEGQGHSHKASEGIRASVSRLQGAVDRGDCAGAISAAASVAVAAASVSF